MATIKLNLSINSSDVLPFVVAIDETKEISTASDTNANASSMGQLVCSSSDAKTINTGIDGGIDNRALVYIKNTGSVATGGAAADPNIIVDDVSDDTDPILEIAPGEFCLFTYNSGANSSLTVETASGTGYCEFLVIELT